MDKMNDLILKKDKKCNHATKNFSIDFAKYFKYWVHINVGRRY